MDLSESLTSTPLYRPYFWLLAAIGALTAAWFAEPSPARNFAATLAASAIIYLGTYVVFGVASDFRYAYWSIVASLAAFAALCACRWRPRASLHVALGVNLGALVLAVAVSAISQS